MYDFDPKSLQAGFVDLDEALANIDGDRELFDAIAAMMVADAPGYLGEFRAHWRAGQRGDAQRVAHTLKGVAGSLGAFRLMALSRRLEELAGAEDVTTIDVTLSALDAEVDAVVARLRELTAG